MEYAVLELLASSDPAIVAKETVRMHLYGGWKTGKLRTIDVLICNLRKKLRKASGCANYICTVPGQGYLLGPSGGSPDRKLPLRMLSAHRWR